MVGVITLLLGIGASKILVCAPSNTGIDEIVRRLITGVTTKSGNKRKVKVSRIASAEAEPSEDILPYTLANLAKSLKEKGAHYTPSDAPMLKQKIARYESLRAEFEKSKVEGVSLKCIELFAEFDKLHPDVKSVDEKIRFLNSECNRMKFGLDTLRLQSASECIGQKVYEESVLREAEVICTTLSTSGIELMNGLKFDYLIIDEACQV